MPEPDAEIISKGDFARRCNVDPGRVSQWIKHGKLTGTALVGEGRSARINVSVAQAQLKRRLDPNQMTANGVHTRIPGGPLLEPPKGAEASPPEVDGVPADLGEAADTTNLEIGDAQDLTVERAGLAREQKLNWRLRNAALRGEMIPAEQAERRWADEMVKLRSRMLAIAGDLPLLLQQLTAHDVLVIDRAIRDAMTEAGDAGPA